MNQRIKESIMPTMIKLIIKWRGIPMRVWGFLPLSPTHVLFASFARHFYAASRRPSLSFPPSIWDQAALAKLALLASASPVRSEAPSLSIRLRVRLLLFPRKVLSFQPTHTYTLSNLSSCSLFRIQAICLFNFALMWLDLRICQSRQPTIHSSSRGFSLFPREEWIRPRASSVSERAGEGAFPISQNSKLIAASRPSKASRNHSVELLSLL